MSREWRSIVVILAVSILGAPAVGLAQSSQPKSDTYTWFGELVSVDATALKMTLRPRVAYVEAVSELKRFSPGEPLHIVWSGMDDYSDAVRTVRRAEPGQKIEDNLVLPAELASTDGLNQQQVTIRVKVPNSSLTSIQAIKPGDWVAVTSRHRPSTDAEAVMAVKPYASHRDTGTD